MTTGTKIVAVLTARPGKSDELQALLFDMRPGCLAEPGAIRWDIWRDQSEPTRFVLDELYVDDDAVAAHRQTPHFKHYLSRINDLADRQPYVLDAVEVD